MKTIAINQRTYLATDWATVWQEVTTLKGINREMMPYLKMSGPEENLVELFQNHPESPLFTSQILMGGWLPVDQMKVTIVDGGEGWFVEQSPMYWMKLWRHERRVEPFQTGCLLSDHVLFRPEIGIMAPVMKYFLILFFQHRHRMLQQHFGRLIPD